MLIPYKHVTIPVRDVVLGLSFCVLRPGSDREFVENAVLASYPSLFWQAPTRKGDGPSLGNLRIGVGHLSI